MCNPLRRFFSVLLVFVLGVLAGCASGEKGSEDEPDASSTKARSVSPKAKPVSTRIIGNWEGKAHFDNASLQEFAKARNISKEEIAEFKKRFEADTFVCSFKKDGTGKGGSVSRDHGGITDIKWKIENESGNRARIVTSDASTSEPGATLDVTFQDDGSMIARSIPNHKDKDKAAFIYTIHLKKVKELPKKTIRKTDEKRMETSRELSE